MLAAFYKLKVPNENQSSLAWARVARIFVSPNNKRKVNCVHEEAIVIAKMLVKH